jgi:hypothetical protein
MPDCLSLSAVVIKTTLYVLSLTLHAMPRQVRWYRKLAF